MKSIWVIIAAFVLVLSSCGQEKHTAEDGHGHEEAEESHDTEEISFTRKQAEAVGLQLEVVMPGEFTESIKASGQVLSAVGDESTIVATSNGVVNYTNTALSDGSAVRHGETIFSISARNMVDGDPSEKAKIAYDVAKKEYERAEKLIRDRIISVKEYEQVRFRYETAKSAYSGVAGISGGKGVKVVSPISGYIKSRLVSQGDYVTVGQPIAVVSKNRRLQLRAEVSERYFNRLEGIKSANFKLSYDSNKVYELSALNGRLLSFGKSSSNSSFYIPITFEFDNIGDIVPGAFAEIYLLGAMRNKVVSVPVSALTEDQGVYYVYIQLDEEGYKKQEVVLGQNNGVRTEILSGLKEGDKVVTQGALQVKMAANSGIIPEGHKH